MKVQEQSVRWADGQDWCIALAHIIEALPQIFGQITTNTSSWVGGLNEIIRGVKQGGSGNHSTPLKKHRAWCVQKCAVQLYVPRARKDINLAGTAVDGCVYSRFATLAK